MLCSQIQYVHSANSRKQVLTQVPQKMDLGACPKSHTERLKTEYNAAREADPNNPIFSKFQQEYENNIFSFVDECDRRIRAAHRRLEKTPEENAKTTNLVCPITLKSCFLFLTHMVQMREIAEIELAIQGGTEKIETLGKLITLLVLAVRSLIVSSGEEGKVDESMREMAAIEALKSEKSEKEVRQSSQIPSKASNMYCAVDSESCSC